MRMARASCDLGAIAPLILLGGVVARFTVGFQSLRPQPAPEEPKQPDGPPPIAYRPRQQLETSGFMAVFAVVPPWRADASLEEYSAAYQQATLRGLSSMALRMSVKPDSILNGPRVRLRGQPTPSFRTPHHSVSSTGPNSL